MHLFRAPTLTSLHEKLTERMAFAPRAKLDAANSVDVQLHNVMAHTPSMEWDFDLKRLWLTEKRWPMLARQYLDPVAVEAWGDAIGDRLQGTKRGIAVMRTKTVRPRQSGRGIIRRWGSCILSVSYRSHPWPQITMHSRTSYLGYIGALDLTLAQLMGQIAAERTGRAVEDVGFVWNLEMAQYHGFKSLAFLLGDPDMAERFRAWSPEDDAPALKISHDWVDRIARMDGRVEGVPRQLYGDMSYSTYRRVRRRYHAECFPIGYGAKFEGAEVKLETKASDQRAYAPLPHFPVTQLDLSCLRDVDVTDGASLVDGADGDAD